MKHTVNIAYPKSNIFTASAAAPGASLYLVEARLDDVRKTVSSHFGRPTCH